MDEFVNAIIRLKVPKWQIGQDIRVFFPDSMVAHGKVEENNYIKRDAVLYYVESHIHEIITESGIDKNAHTNRVLRAIVNGIKTMPPCKGNNGWIPCSERLPERDVEVLAYHRDISFDYQYVSWIDDYSGRWCGFIGNLPDDVIAWMPLPKSYKEVNE